MESLQNNNAHPNGVQPIISFRNVSKQFTFTSEQPQSLMGTLASIVKLKNRNRPKEILWAVHDVSFDVLPGQSLGIIGRNGSGKSTVLKLMARILRPTSGQMMVRGRVSALLELGAGFHPDLTGRENIALNASVLGLTEEEVNQNFDSIVEFSELGEFINMPVKHYSSGMYMRLGFSVAIHVNPDILIVDEILAVGDQTFQMKCIDRISDLKRQGVTIIIISHNLDMIRRLCSDLVWLENGTVRSYGRTSEIANEYDSYSNAKLGQQLVQDTELGDYRRWGNHEIEITDVRFLNNANEAQNVFKTGDAMTIEIAYLAHKPVNNPEFGLAIHRQDGIHMNGPNSRLGGLETGFVEGAGIVRYEVESLPFLPARYQVTAAVHDSRLPITYDYHEHAFAFRVMGGGTDEEYGLIEVPANWTWTATAESKPSKQLLVESSA